MELSWPNAFLTGWVFRTILLRNAYALERTEQLAGESRFKGGQLIPEGIGFELRLTR